MHLHVYLIQTKWIRILLPRSFPTSVYNSMLVLEGVYYFSIGRKNFSSSSDLLSIVRSYIRFESDWRRLSASRCVCSALRCIENSPPPPPIICNEGFSIHEEGSRGLRMYVDPKGNKAHSKNCQRNRSPRELLDRLSA